MKPDYIDRKELLAELDRRKVPYFAEINEIILSMPVQPKILYYCDQRDISCKNCSRPIDTDGFGCRATFHIEHADSFFMNEFGDFVEKRLAEEDKYYG